MTRLIIVLIAISFLQGVILPINLVLIILIARSFVMDDRANFYLAFALGLWLSFLLGAPLGGLSLLYLFAVLSVQTIKSIHLFAHWSVIIPASMLILAFSQLVSGVASGASITSSINLSLIIAEAFFVLPVYVLVRFWEERFVPRSDIKLKIGR